jgi:hypothetical protein
MKLFLKTVGLPATLLVLNYALQFFYNFVPAPFGVITFNLVRLVLAAWAGWRVTSRGIGGLTQAAAAGAVLLFVDHVIIRGGSFLVAQIIAPPWVDNKGFQAFGGVLVSYVIFVWIPVVFSIAGGMIGRRSTVAA